MHTLTKHFGFIVKTEQVDSILLNLVIHQIYKYEFAEAIKTIDVALKIIGTLPKHATLEFMMKGDAMRRLNIIKKVLNADLDTRTVI